MIALIIGAGIGFLIAAAAIIGQERAAEHAWREIARERRDLHSIRVALDGLAEDLAEENLRLQEFEARLVLTAEQALQHDETGPQP